MLRLYKFDNPYEHKDFEGHIFTTLKPRFDHQNDKVIVMGTVYRISTINHMGMFNLMLANQPQYNMTINQDETYAVLENNSDFYLNIIPKPSGCVVNIKVKKTTAADIVVSLPLNSFGKNISLNQLTLSGNQDETFILSGIYEGGEFDWLLRNRSNAFDISDYQNKGYSETLNKEIDVVGISQALDTLFNVQAQSPLVALTSAPIYGLREYGDFIDSVVLSANVTKRTNPILSVEFKRNSVQISLNESPSSEGGTEQHTDNTPIQDNTSYQVIVSDGILTASATRTFSFVYPFYWGVGSQSLTAVQIQALTKSISTKGQKVVNYSPINQVYYFAYPSSYGDLSSIIDPNGFETIGGYTKRLVDFSMLDGTTQQYNVYEFNNLTTQSNFANTFIF